MPPAFKPDAQEINVIIESPRSSANKYSFDQEAGLFRLSKILPQGMVFPLHFGFIPGTRGEDGDPVDVLVLMDESSYPGCLVECRVLGIIEARQTERDGETMRNDRVIAAAVASERYAHTSLKDLETQLEEIEHFFINYNAMAGKTFVPIKNRGPVKAIRLIKKSLIH